MISPFYYTKKIYYYAWRNSSLTSMNKGTYYGYDYGMGMGCWIWG